jgi:hypothetical protein
MKTKVKAAHELDLQEEMKNSICDQTDLKEEDLSGSLSRQFNQIRDSLYVPF